MVALRTLTGKLFVALSLILLISAHLGDSSVTKRPKNTDTVTDFLSKSFTALKAFSDAIGKDGYNLQKFAGVVSALGPALGVVGPVFALATVLIPQGPSPELEAIRNGFERVNVRFDNVDKKLDDILLNIEKAVVYESYKENQDNLQRVVLKFDQFQRVPGAPASLELEEACSRNDPDVAIDWIYRNCVQEQVGAELLDTIFKDVKYDRKLLLQFFQIILKDYTQATFLRQVCLGVRFPNATDVMEDNKKQDQQKLEAIHTKLVQIDKDLVNFFYKTQLESDMTAQLEIGQKQKLSHQDVAQNLKAHLETKYFWVDWAAHVYDPVEGYQMHAVHCFNTSQFGCQFVWRKFERNVVVAWNEQDTRNAVKAIEQYKKITDNVNCEKSAKNLNDDLWAWDGVKGRKIVLVVAQSANLASAHGADEVEAPAMHTSFLSCKKFNVVFGF